MGRIKGWKERREKRCETELRGKGEREEKINRDTVKKGDLGRGL